MKLLSVVSLVGLCLLVSSCGWQVRSGNLAAVSENVELRLETALEAQLQQKLERVFGSTEAQPQSATLRVTILDYRYFERTQTVTSRLHVDTIRLSMSFDYRIEDEQNNLTEHSTASSWRDIEFTDANPASNERESTLLRAEMSDDLVNQLVFHIQRIADDN